MSTKEDSEQCPWVVVMVVEKETEYLNKGSSNFSREYSIQNIKNKKRSLRYLFLESENTRHYRYVYWYTFIGARNDDCSAMIHTS